MSNLFAAPSEAEDAPVRDEAPSAMSPLPPNEDRVHTTLLEKKVTAGHQLWQTRQVVILSEADSLMCIHKTGTDRCTRIARERGNGLSEPSVSHVRVNMHPHAAPASPRQVVITSKAVLIARPVVDMTIDWFPLLAIKSAQHVQGIPSDSNDVVGQVAGDSNIIVITLRQPPEDGGGEAPTTGPSHEPAAIPQQRVRYEGKVSRTDAHAPMNVQAHLKKRASLSISLC